MKPIVFLVKNESGIKSSLKSVIENDFTVFEINPCSSVLALLQTAIPDIIIIEEDILDPAAYKVCQQIKFSERYYFIPLIFKGPPLSPENNVRFMESGADDYYAGSLDGKDTVAYLNNLISRTHSSKRPQFRSDKFNAEINMEKMPAYKAPDPDLEVLVKAAFRQSAVGIVQVSPKGQFQKVNERFCDIVGYTREELLSMNFRELTYPDDSRFEQEMLSLIFEGEIDFYETEKRYIRKNGSLVWIKLYSSVIRDDSGAVKYGIGIVADISRQKKAQQSLHESDIFFRTMFQSSGIGIVRLSASDKRIEQANAAFCNMLGYTEEELIGKSLMEISYHEDLAENIEKQDKLLRGEISSIQMEKRYIHKDGHHVWGLLNSNLISDENGNPRYFIGNVVDITESKKSQHLLKESEEKYRTYVDNSPYPILAADINGNYVDANPAACALTGYSWKELTSMKITDLCSPEYWDLAADTFKEIVKGKKVTEEYLFIKKDGTHFYMMVSAVLVKDTVLGLCVDTTERKRTEKVLIEAKMLAEDASKSKTEFVSNVSHELRTPLNIVIGYSDILLTDMSGELNDKQRKYAARIKDAGSSLLDIVDSLIYIAEIEAGDWEIHRSEFDLPSLIENMKKITTHSAYKKSLSLEFEVSDNVSAVTADESKFKIILHHIIGNAIKFTPVDGSVKVFIDQNEDELRVSVSDTGIGIPEDKQEYLFNPFVQLDWSHARRYGGMGIGLTLVKELVEMHGGSIGLQSKVGQGTTITFTIPQ